MLALCPLIPRFDLANPEEMQKTPKEIRFNVAIRYGLQQVLLRTEGNYNPALQITREILDKRVANIARRMIIDDMLVEDRLDDAVAVARTIELEQEKDAALEECVICYAVHGQSATGISIAQEIAALPMRQFALLTCMGGYYKEGKFEEGNNIWNKMLSTFSSLPVPSILHNVFTSFSPEMVREVAHFYRTAPHVPEKDVLVSFIAFSVSSISFTSAMELIDLLGDEHARNLARFRCLDCFIHTIDKSLDLSEKYSKFSLALENAEKITSPTIKTAILVQSFVWQVYTNFSPVGIILYSSDISDVEEKCVAHAKNETRRDIDGIDSKFFHRLNNAVYNNPPDFIKERNYLPISQCIEYLISVGDVQSAARILATMHPDIFAEVASANIDEMKSSNTSLLQERLARGDDMGVIELLQMRTKGVIPVEKMEQLFAIAKKSGNTTACLKLINRGYDAKEMKHECLRWAHELGMFKTAFILLEAGGQIALTQEEKNEYLRNAILSSRSKAALILLDQITHVNAQDNDLNTFLHLACKKELVDVVEKLIHKGADKTLKNIKGHTLLDIAAKRQHAPLLALLNGRA